MFVHPVERAARRLPPALLLGVLGCLLVSSFLPWFRVGGRLVLDSSGQLDVGQAEGADRVHGGAQTSSRTVVSYATVITNHRDRTSVAVAGLTPGGSTGFHLQRDQLARYARESSALEPAVLQLASYLGLALLVLLRVALLLRFAQLLPAETQPAVGPPEPPAPSEPGPSEPGPSRSD